jgi:hypothetical protein|tara:strand:+ start:475 stop:651 length:177 start_codon:yes stop_codon:yes gene_type:complete
MVNYDDNLYQEIVNYYSYNDAIAALKIDDSTINQYSTIITSATLPIGVFDRTIQSEME